MAQIQGTVLAAKISPGDDTATFPTHEDIYGKGGLMSVQTLSELSTGIPVDRQKVGMMIYVSDTSSYYTLTSTSYPLTSISPVSNTFATKDYTHSNFFPLTGNATITGPTTVTGTFQVNNNVFINGNLSASGTSTFANTIFSTTTSLSVVHIGAGPALWVGNNGTGDIASFYDIDQNIEVLHVAGFDGSNPGVGVNTSTPNKPLTVNGEISANNIIWDATGNSINWNSVYTTAQTNSATTWNYQGTDLKNLSSGWLGGNIAYTNLVANSGAYLSGVDLSFLSVSGNWNETYTAVLPNSGNWNSVYSSVCALSTSWSDGAGTLVQSNSANWNSTYTTMTANSANWNIAYNAINNYSSNWARSYFTNSDDQLEKFTFYINGNAGTTHLAGEDGVSWTRWFVNFGTGVLSGENYDQGYRIYVNPNEVKKIYYDGTQYDVLSTSYISNSRNWDSTYTTMTANSANWNNTYTAVSPNSANWNSVYSSVCALSTNWEESADILPTVTNYLSTNNVLLLSATILNTLSARSYVNNPTGKTIYVDAGIGTDTRTNLSKYDQFKPFATLSAAAAASVTGDLVYVRAGSYFITSQINLNGEGSLYFDPGAVVTVPTGVIAFSYSQNSIPIYIRGHADFALAGSAGVLTMSGNNATAVAFECNSITGPDSVTGTLFNCASGVLSVDAKTIAMTTTFTASNATVFNITGSGQVTVQVPFVYCGVFVNGAGSANAGDAAPATINADVWTLATYNETAGMNLNLITTSFRIVNYGHVGVGAAFSWTENTTRESHVFRGITWTSFPLGKAHMTFASTAGSTSLKRINLDQTNILRAAATHSLSASVPIDVYTYGSFAKAPANSNVTFKVGAFTVDAAV